MNRSAILLIALVTAGCMPARGATLQMTLEQLATGDAAERDEAFQRLTQAAPHAAASLKPLVALDPAGG